MWMTRVAINNPVFATMVMVALCVLGLFSYSKLGVEQSYEKPLHGLTGNPFMTPNVIGEVTVVPNNRTYAGGKRADIAVFELTVPSFVLPTQELKDAWISEGTAIIETAAEGRIRREQIFANVRYAVDGGWGIGGKAFSNAALGSAVAAA